MSTRDSEQPDDLSETVESRDERFLVGEYSDYSEAFLAASDQYQVGDLDGALRAYEAILATHDGPVADADFLSVSSAALNRASARPRDVGAFILAALACCNESARMCLRSPPLWHSLRWHRY
jgi:hypothetical protein